MDLYETVYREAVRHIDAGHHSYIDVLEHCLDKTSLAAIAADQEIEVEDALLEILGMQGEICISEGPERVMRIDVMLDGLTLTHRAAASRGTCRDRGAPGRPLAHRVGACPWWPDSCPGGG